MQEYWLDRWLEKVLEAIDAGSPAGVHEAGTALDKALEYPGPLTPAVVLDFKSNAKRVVKEKDPSAREVALALLRKKACYVQAVVRASVILSD